MNYNVTNVYGRVLSPISKEPEVTFPAKCKGPLVWLVSA